jgi:hypothetical protein
VIVREPGQFIGVKVDQEKFTTRKKAIYVNADPDEHDVLQRLLQDDYKTVASNILFAIQQRRAAGK